MDKKKFYRELGKRQVTDEKPPSKEEVEKFWSSIWCIEKEFNEEAEWLKQEEERCEGLEQQKRDEIKEVELMGSLRKAQKWKSPGIDKVLNSLDSIHENITKCYNRAITNPETNPQWFTQGITYLLPKSNETNIPKNINTKSILTSIVTERIYNFLDLNNILPSEQKGRKKGHMAAKTSC